MGRTSTQGRVLEAALSGIDHAVIERGGVTVRADGPLAEKIPIPKDPCGRIGRREIGAAQR